MNYNIKISKEGYTLAMLKVVNCFLNMTDYELDIVNKMIDNNIRILTTSARAEIRKLTGNKSVALTNNYIKRLVDKKVLITTDDGLVLNQSIVKPVIDKSITVSFSVN